MQKYIIEVRIDKDAQVTKKGKNNYGMLFMQLPNWNGNCPLYAVKDEYGGVNLTPDICKATAYCTKRAADRISEILLSKFYRRHPVISTSILKAEITPSIINVEECNRRTDFWWKDIENI